ncbi:MAG: fatty acid desaturase [Treponema sp.]|nr:fatty acid desaturase [Treponema sp.]
MDRKAVVQLVDTILPYLVIFLSMLIPAQRGTPICLTLLISLLAGAFLIRSFIFFHDCCHGSFLSSRRWNDGLGKILGILTFTPFADWRWSHGIHHSPAGNLDRRGLGDVWTMTVAEYRDSSRARCFLYRFYRNPVVLFILGPFFIFVLTNRYPSKGAKGRQPRDLGVHDVAVAGMGLALSFFPGSPSGLPATSVFIISITSVPGFQTTGCSPASTRFPNSGCPTTSISAGASEQSASSFGMRSIVFSYPSAD